MAANSFETLKQVIEANSVANDFYNAAQEWGITSVDEHPSNEGECVCGQQHLLYMYTIQNHHTGQSLEYIGSKCVQHFQRGDLNLQVTIFRGLFELRKKILAGEHISLTSDYFSRGILAWLYDEGAFPATPYNGNDGGNDYRFLLDMFNKRNKNEISQARQNKIRGLLHYTVKPFIRYHPALG
ncbi:hypothetical protein [Glutamicibacter protophormiae]|uniref:Uncharacterized protein n=1 Tax=Glutamicibacter protophormiae TaxID=37930 RepID=A0ABS4XMR3_GLUPR|nr:hypothetical protein [Glutamicibacter protophormiae]MBP2397811.1 hypothetical protein [Glutamicibacter protophormiae]GGL86397.1 hypothetical protein GCM10010038_15490 [Glutamicibacter protophormiae]